MLAVYTILEEEKVWNEFLSDTLRCARTWTPWFYSGQLTAARGNQAIFFFSSTFIHNTYDCDDKRWREEKCQSLKSPVQKQVHWKVVRVSVLQNKSCMIVLESWCSRSHCRNYKKMENTERKWKSETRKVCFFAKAWFHVWCPKGELSCTMSTTTSLTQYRKQLILISRGWQYLLKI